MIRTSPPHDSSFAPVTSLPETVGEDHHRVRPGGGVLLREEGPAPGRLDSQDVEVVSGDHLPQEHLSPGIVMEDGGLHGVGRDFPEDVRGPVPNQLVDVVVALEMPAVFGEGVYVHQPFGLGYAPLLEEDGVHQGVEGGIGPDSHGQGENRHGGEARGLSKGTQGQGKVAED